MSTHKKITVSENGPYLVSGSVPLVFQTIGANDDGESSEWVEGDALPTFAQYALCRCGASNTKPFCDGTYAKIGFDGSETASHEPIMQQAELLDGPDDAARRCRGLMRVCALLRSARPRVEPGGKHR